MAQANFQHVMRIKGWDYAVVGQQNPFLGRGGGQFANHSRNKANCIIIVKTATTDQWMMDSSLPLVGTVFPILLLVATRYIKAGEEILWAYPRNTLVRCGISETDEQKYPNPSDKLDRVWPYPKDDDPPRKTVTSSRRTKDPRGSGKEAPQADEAEEKVEVKIEK